MAGNGQEWPNITMELPTLVLDRTTGLRHGVDVERIKEWWENRRTTLTTYAFLSKRENCTGCVVEALRAGGLDGYHQHPNNLFIQDARTLWTWVTAAVDRINLANERQRKIDHTLLKVTTGHGGWIMEKGAGFIGTIPSLEEWKTESDKKVRFAAVARRIDQVARLDKLIEKYHKTNDSITQLGYLVRMLYQIYRHLATKPTSDRRDAVTKLGVRVYAVFWTLCLELTRSDQDESSLGPMYPSDSLLVSPVRRLSGSLLSPSNLIESRSSGPLPSLVTVSNRPLTRSGLRNSAFNRVLENDESSE
jgi:hypothetical protein